MEVNNLNNSNQGGKHMKMEGATVSRSQCGHSQ